MVLRNRILLNSASTWTIVAFILSSIPLTAHSQDASGVSAAAAVSSPVPASASSSPETVPSGAADSGLGEIVVTAQKRSETAQRVAAAITVMSDETLVQRDVVDLLGIENLMPSAKMNITAHSL